MYAFARRNDPARQKLSAIMLLLATLALMLACAVAAGNAHHGQQQGPIAHKQFARVVAAPLDDGTVKAEMTAKALGLPSQA